MNEMTLTLNSPITEEQWDAITDVDFEHTNEVTFHTKHGKKVKFVKVPAQPEQRWILCSERLPEANGRYLVTRGLNAGDAMWNRVHLIHYSDLMGLKSERIWWDGTIGKLDFERIDDVLAWMPLPEAYRGKGEQDG